MYVELVGDGFPFFIFYVLLNKQQLLDLLVFLLLLLLVVFNPLQECAGWAVFSLFIYFGNIFVCLLLSFPREN